MVRTQAGVPGYNLQKGRAGTVCSTLCIPRAVTRYTDASEQLTTAGPYADTSFFFFPLEPAIVFEMGLVSVFIREVGRLAPRHTAAEK